MQAMDPVALAAADTLEHDLTLADQALGSLAARSPSAGPAEIELFGVVGLDFNAADVRAALRSVQGRDLIVRINSPGGSVSEGFAAFNALRRHEGHKIISVEGMACSIAAFMAMAGDEVVAPRASLMMIHNSSGAAIGNSATMASVLGVLGKIDGIQADIFSARTGLEREKVVAMLAEETYFTAEEAVEAGLADRLEDREVEATAVAGLIARAPEIVAMERVSPVALGVPATDQGRAALMDAVAQARIPLSTQPAAPAQAKEVSVTVQTNPAGQSPAPDAILAAATIDQIKAIAARGKLDQAMADRFVIAQLEAKATVEAATSALIDAMAQEAPQRPAAQVAVMNDDRKAQMREAMEHSIMARAGIAGFDPVKARDFQGLTLSEMGREAITAMGGNTRGMDRHAIAGAALGMPSFLASAGLHTTSDFPLVLANVARKTLLNAFSQVVQDWRPLVRVSSHSDYKPVNYVRMGDAPDLLETAEHQPYTYGTMSETGEQLQIKKYGRIFGVTREVLINDDLGAFTRLPALFGTSAGRTIRKAFWANFIAPPVLSDGVAFYHANHGNLAASGGPINTTTVAAARKAMRVQKNQDGNPVDVQPRYLVVSPDKETEAQAFLASDTLADQSRNIFANSLTLIVSPYLTGNTWYILAAPGETEAFYISFLNGREEPRIEERVGFEVDGLEIKAAIDFGVGAIDWRGAYKNPGA